MSQSQVNEKAPVSSSEEPIPDVQLPGDGSSVASTAKQLKRINVERYAYYIYFFANSGLGPFNYSALLFQNLIYQAGFDPDVSPIGSQPCGDSACHVFWAGGSKPYASVVNIGAGLTFLGQALFFIILGATADYGTWSPWILRISTIVYSAFQLGYLGVTTPDTWPAAMALYIVSNIGWAISFTFFVALFPSIAADQVGAAEARSAKDSGEISEAQYDAKMEMERSKIMNRSWAWNNVGATVSPLLCLAALKGIDADASIEKNNQGYSACTAVCAGITILFSIPWFFLQKKRPRKPITEGTNVISVGLKNYWRTTTMMATQLPQTFFYIVISFFLSDAITTLMTEVAIAQSSVVAFSVTSNTYFLIVQCFSAVVFPYLGVWVQGILELRTKTLLHVSNLCSLILAIWGTAGIWTTTVGYHNVWEFWLYSAVCGVAIGLQWSYAQAFMGELVPKGEENHFFSLLGVVSKGGAWVGPIVSSALIDRAENSWVPFAFLALLIATSSFFVFFVDEVKARADCEKYLKAKGEHHTD